jgi:hypothetical protein
MTTPGRDTVMILAKSVVAGAMAWTLATNVFHATYATFAAFTAMLLMHHTIAESIEKALHYTAAVLVGIGLVGVAVLPWGAQLWLFPIILLVTLVIGRWHRLGSQGFNVTVAAVFAYGVFAIPNGGKPPLTLIRDLAAMVLLGAGVAVVTNLLIAPPLRYRSAAAAVERYCEAVTELFGDMAGGLEGGVPDPDDARDWRRRGDELPRMAAQARSVLDHAWETSKLNPRRLLARDHSSFDGHRVTVHAVERIAEQLRAVSGGFVRVSAQHDEHRAPPVSARDEFLQHYANVLTAVRDAVAAAAAIHTIDDLRHDQSIAEAAGHCRSALQGLGTAADIHRLDLPDHWAIYGALYTDAQRLCEEVDWLREALSDAARSLP